MRLAFFLSIKEGQLLAAVSAIHITENHAWRMAA
jgi:hypothetical protein